MFPVLIGEGQWALPSYFTMVMLGFLVGYFLFRIEARKNQWSMVHAADFIVIMIVASIVGARVTSVLFDGFLSDYISLCLDPSELAKMLPSGAPCLSDAQCAAAAAKGHDIGSFCVNSLCQPQRDCFRALKFYSGGLTYYGGFLAALFTSIVLARRWKWPFLQLADSSSAGIAIGVAFGRLGCFLAGCCFGATCDLPWAVRFPIYSDAWRLHRKLNPELLNSLTQQTYAASLPVHPTQLYEALLCIAIFIVIWFGLRKRKYKRYGVQIAFLMISYGIGRFLIEMVRADARGGYILSTSQWISLPLVVTGAVILYRAVSGPKGVEGSEADDTGGSLPPRSS